MLKPCSVSQQRLLSSSPTRPLLWPCSQTWLGNTPPLSRKRDNIGNMKPEHSSTCASGLRGLNTVINVNKACYVWTFWIRPYSECGISQLRRVWNMSFSLGFYWSLQHRFLPVYSLLSVCVCHKQTASQEKHKEKGPHVWETHIRTDCKIRNIAMPIFWLRQSMHACA